MSLLNIMDAVNRVALPILIMLTSSLILFVSILRMQTRIEENFQSKKSKSLRNQIRLLVTLILLNLTSIVLTIPCAMIENSDQTSVYFYFYMYLWFVSYACNFYIIFATNSLFRKQFIKFFQKMYNYLSP